MGRSLGTNLKLALALLLLRYTLFNMVQMYGTMMAQLRWCCSVSRSHFSAFKGHTDDYVAVLTLPSGSSVFQSLLQDRHGLA